MLGVKPSNVILSFNVCKYKILPNQIISSLLNLQQHHMKFFFVDVLYKQTLNNVYPLSIIIDINAKNQNDIVLQAKQSHINVLS